MPKAKIAFSYDCAYPWHVGGIETINMLESSALAKKFDVYFYTLRWPGMRRRFVMSGVRYDAMFRISQRRLYLHKRRSIRAALMYSLSMFRLFGNNFDLLVVDEFPYLHLPVVMLYKKFSGAKVAIRVAEVWDLEYWRRYLGVFGGSIAYFLSKTLIRGADIYIANTENTKELISKEYGISNNKIEVFTPVLNDSEVALARRRNKDCSSRQIVFAGRLIKEKRLDLWLSTVREVIHKMPDVTGVIIGDGPERDSIKSMIKNMGLERSVKMLSPLPKSRLYKEIRCSAMLLNMSEREGLSMITLESLALGTPVVLPSNSPIPKEIKRLCVVEESSQLPGRIIEMIRKGKKDFHVDASELSKFSVSNILPFYEKIMKKLGIT